jgi:hypothetical protein
MFVALELKKSFDDLPKNELDLQAHKLKKIIRAGGIGIFVYPENFDKIKTALTVLSRKGVYDRTNLGGHS